MLQSDPEMCIEQVDSKELIPQPRRNKTGPRYDAGTLKAYILNGLIHTSHSNEYRVHLIFDAT
ncbi:MAG: hypothetical protein ACYCYO_00330 [Bacilli bacterium]